MKKTLACVALVGALGMTELPALDLSMLSFDAKLGYESEYVTHGRKEGQENLQFAVEVGADIGGGHLYGGATSVLLFKDSSVPVPVETSEDEVIAISGANVLSIGLNYSGALDFLAAAPLPWYSSFWSSNSISPYAGYTFGAGELIKADVGFIAHVYTNLKNYKAPQGVTIARNTNELYGGVRIDVLCDPSIYAFYDIDREEFAFVAAGSYSLDLSSFGLNNISLEARATAGYDYTKRPYGGKFFVQTSDAPGETFADDSKDYFYYCLEGIAAYRYNDNVVLKGRVSYSGNTASEGSWTNAIFGGKHKNCVWLGGSLEVGF